MDKPDCYKCKNSCDITGDAHKSCSHPLAMLLGEYAMTKLNIEYNEHAREKGWFYWPYSFDPIWLNTCNGFENKKE
jgi:hypothetical protein